MPARRRRTEQDGGADDALELTAADLDRRDRLDSGRTASPLVQAADAVVLDTTAADARRRPSTRS